MTCRESRLSSAIVTFARDMTGLEDNQILALNHALMQEGAQHGVSAESWAAIIDATQEQYRNGQLTIGNRSRDPLTRLEAARTENPDAGRIYAATRLIQRAQLADEAQREYLTDVARDLGLTYDQAQREFQAQFAEATADASLEADGDFVRSWTLNPDHSSMLVDRRSLYAYSMLETDRESSFMSRAYVAPSEELIPSNSDSTARVAGMTYSPQTGHLETSYRHADGSTRTETYNVPASVADSLRSTWSRTSSHEEVSQFFLNEIRGNSDYQYQNSADSARGARALNCATCGQFRTWRGSHTCPVPGSPAALDADVRRAVDASELAPVPAPVAAPTSQLVYTLDPETGVLSRPAIRDREQMNSSFIREIGYDPINQRLELCFRDSAHVYTYCIEPDYYNEFRNADSMGSYFTTRIRNNPAFQWPSEEAELQSRTHLACAGCGQFRSPFYHECPGVQTAQTDVTDAAQAPAAMTAADVDNVIADLQAAAEAANPSSLPADIVEVSSSRTTRYEIDGSIIRMPGMRRLQREARENGSVTARIFAIRPGEGALGSSYNVGQVVVSYANGRYTVEPVTDGLNSRRLRCTCDVYQRNYRCEHTEGAANRLGRALNGETESQIVSASAAMSATQTIAADAALEVERNAQALVSAQERYTPMGTSFSDDPEKFQGLYEEYRAKREAYKAAVAEGRTDVEYPIPYIRENALGGLGTRESGRGFGIEVEFAFPQDMSAGDRRNALRAIGRELYDAGLTRNENQQGYGASHGWFRDTHDRGWSFESDPSTGGSDGQHGGEIVSPVMYDEAQTWEAMEKVANVLTAHGAIASRGSGMHVHVSTGDYGQNVANHNRLLNAFHSNEDLLYRLGSNPERGRHRGTGYCSPNNASSSPYTDVATARRHNDGHHIGLNFQSVNGRNSDHMELRAFDATLNPAAMQAQIATAVYIAEGAVRGVGSETPNEGHSPLGSRLSANPSRGGLGGAAWNESTAGFRSFLDKFVQGSGGDETENPRVRQLVALFASTKWQKQARGW